MLIWLGKQMLGQEDKADRTGSVDTWMRVIVEFLGEPAPIVPQIDHAALQRFTPRLVTADVEWKA